MKLAFAAAIALAVSAGSALAQTHVRGYFRNDGTYVAPHVRSAPNNSTYDNWSTAPNVNPYTGRTGTVNPDPTYQPYRAPTYQPYQAPTYQPYRPQNTTQQPRCIYYTPC